MSSGDKLGRPPSEQALSAKQALSPERALSAGAQSDQAKTPEQAQPRRHKSTMIGMGAIQAPIVPPPSSQDFAAQPAQKEAIHDPIGAAAAHFASTAANTLVDGTPSVGIADKATAAIPLESIRQASASETANASRRRAASVAAVGTPLQEDGQSAAPTSSRATAGNIAEQQGSKPPLNISTNTMSHRAVKKRGFGSRLWSLVKWGSLAALLAGLGLGLFGYNHIREIQRELPSVASLKDDYHPPQVTKVTARDGTVLTSIFSERRTVIPFEEIPDTIRLAFLAAEDAHFYEHSGLNYIGLARAVLENLRPGGKRQGGSTITQQLVKNVLLDSSRTLDRKLKEGLLALRIEAELSKDEIFSLYLNQIYLGHGRYGVEEAALNYFGKHASELSLDEASLIAGTVASPENYSPRRNLEKALTRRSFVLRQMKEKKFITEEMYEAAKDAPVRLAPMIDAESDIAPEIILPAKKALRLAAGEDSRRGGFSVVTTIDPTLQSYARTALRNNLDAYSKRNGIFPPYTSRFTKLWGKPFDGTPKPYRIYTGQVTKIDDESGEIEVQVGTVSGKLNVLRDERYNPKKLPPSQFTKIGGILRVSIIEQLVEGQVAPLVLELGPQSAMVVLDVRSAEVLAVVGSYEGVAHGLNRATNARRQPGSTFKALTYSYGLHSKQYTAASVFEVKHRGHGVPLEGLPIISLRESLAHSNNEVAVEVFKRLGPTAVVNWAKQFGIESKLEPDLSLALGAYEVTPMEMAGAYATFARGGVWKAPRMIREIEFPEGESGPQPSVRDDVEVLSSEESYLTTSLLQSVISRGTGSAALSLRRPLAGKTGTTNQSKDAWFIGYSPELLCAVWVGYDDAKPLGKSESGAKTAQPAWIEFMQKAHEGRPVTDFPRPGGLISVAVDPASGLLARDGENSVEELFIVGTEPTELSPLVEEEIDEDGVTSPDDPRTAGVSAENSAQEEGEGMPEVKAPEPLIPASEDEENGSGEAASEAP